MEAPRNRRLAAVALVVAAAAVAATVGAIGGWSSSSRTPCRTG